MVRTLFFSLGTLLMAPTPVLATGHGPVYGLATPTLGKGAWSLDMSVMYRLVGDTNEQRMMLRPMLSYGITEDVQASLTLPLPLSSSSAPVPEARMMAMIPNHRDRAEAHRCARDHRIEEQTEDRIQDPRNPLHRCFTLSRFTFLATVPGGFLYQPGSA